MICSSDGSSRHSNMLLVIYEDGDIDCQVQILAVKELLIILSTHVVEFDVAATFKK